MKAILESVLLMLLVAPSVSADEAADAPTQNTRWQDLVVGRDAIDLAAKHPLVAEHMALERILLPPKNIQRDIIEKLYGKHDKILPKNAKQPNDLHQYTVTDHLSLLIYYKNDRVEGSRFNHHDARGYLIAAEIGKPTYSDLVHDLELKVNNLGVLLVKLKLPSIAMPWPH